MNGIIETVTGLGSNIAAFVFALGVIIFVHEAGHLIVAKLFGMRVLAFSLGFGKRIWPVQPLWQLPNRRRANMYRC